MSLSPVNVGWPCHLMTDTVEERASESREASKDLVASAFHCLGELPRDCRVKKPVWPIGGREATWRTEAAQLTVNMQYQLPAMLVGPPWTFQPN